MSVQQTNSQKIQYTAYAPTALMTGIASNRELVEMNTLFTKCIAAINANILDDQIANCRPLFTEKMIRRTKLSVSCHECV